ncbi:MAG: tol-pal system-associated acyl-CoA thioesterase [Methylobacterium mesophilicum]|nr:tol-pal system-associated acyl-CoA thioesterase [Methylobacterium mesophilicum]
MSEHGERPVPLSGELTAAGHRTWARVYYADTDFSGVVYHARYLEFLERGRSDFLRLVGVHHNELIEQAIAIVWVVRRMDIRFLKPARIDDILTVETRTEAVSGARITMHQRISRGHEALIEAQVEAATVGADGRPRRFPKEWIAAFMPHEPR